MTWYFMLISGLLSVIAVCLPPTAPYIIFSILLLACYIGSRGYPWYLRLLSVPLTYLALKIVF